MEKRLVWFLSAVFISLATSFVGFQEYPGDWTALVALIGAIAQGLLAWRAFVAPPPMS